MYKNKIYLKKLWWWCLFNVKFLEIISENHSVIRKKKNGEYVYSNDFFLKLCTRFIHHKSFNFIIICELIYLSKKITQTFWYIIYTRLIYRYVLVGISMF